MPTGLRGGAQGLEPPETRVLQAWARAWRGVLVNGRRTTQRTLTYAAAIRRLR